MTTVLGDVTTDQFETVLPHEHTFIRLWAAPGRFDGVHQVEDEGVLAEEVGQLRQGRDLDACLVDLTTPDLGRRPAAIQAVAEASGWRSSWGAGGIGNRTTGPRTDSTAGPSTTLQPS